MFIKVLKSVLIAMTSASALACANPKYLPPSLTSKAGLSKPTRSCQAQFKDGRCVAVEWETYPTDSAKGSFLLKVFREQNAKPVLENIDGELKVFLWMPDMGHGSSPVQVTAVDVGTYRVSDVFFVMAGQWEIHFQQKVNDAVTDEAVLNIQY